MTDKLVAKKTRFALVISNARSCYYYCYDTDIQSVLPKNLSYGYVYAHMRTREHSYKKSEIYAIVKKNGLRKMTKL